MIDLGKKTLRVRNPFITEVAAGRGEIIDHERQVGGYPAVVDATASLSIRPTGTCGS